MTRKVMHVVARCCVCCCTFLCMLLHAVPVVAYGFVQEDHAGDCRQDLVSGSLYLDDASGA